MLILRDNTTVRDLLYAYIVEHKEKKTISLNIFIAYFTRQEYEELNLKQKSCRSLVYTCNQLDTVRMMCLLNEAL